MIALLSLILGHTPVVLDDGHAVRQVVSVVPWVLDQPYTYAWSAERPSVDRGLLVVLDVEPSWLLPSNTHQAVLYAGAVPVERLNTGFPSGRIAVLVPFAESLADTVFAFGGYELPERVDAAFGAEVARLARSRGLRPLPAPPSAPTQRLADVGALYQLGWAQAGIDRP